jgi:tetratricopeptide (TPR) repeat protein
MVDPRAFLAFMLIHDQSTPIISMKIALSLLIPILLVAPTIAADYLAEFEKLQSAGDDRALREFVTKSAETQIENPDYYASAGNYWWQLSQKTTISTKPVEADDLAIAEEKSGAEIGSISTLGRSHPEIPKKALDTLIEGVRRFPHRVDLVLGLAHVQREMNLYAACTNTLKKLLDFAKKNPDSLRWKKNASLPAKANEMIPEAIQGYAAALYQSETAENDALCATLCDATIEAFPDHPFAYNIKAALAAAAGQDQASLKLLETAHRKAPTDALILLNLGDAYQKADQQAKAKESYQAVLQLRDIDDSLKEQAREALQQIK